MEDLKSRRLEALSALIEGLRSARSEPDVEGSLDALRRILRSLAHTADDVDLPEVAARARAVRGRPRDELSEATDELLDWLESLAPREEPGRSQAVLVVEDDDAIAADLAAHLEGEGRVVHRAATAADAERMLSEHPIDVLLLDLVLPDRDGREFLLQLREDPVTGAVPVIVLAARARGVTRAECRAAGASELFEKPVDAAALRATVVRLLDDERRDVDVREDPGTSLLSRAGLTEAYGVLRSRSGKVEGPLAVAVLGVEPYDDILRTLGRDGGDRLLKDVAARVRDACGPRDVLGRWTESELLGLFPGTSPSDARARIEQGLSRLAQGNALEWPSRAGVDISLTFACGVSVAEAGDDLREAALAAERSMQPAHSEAGRVTFEPEDPEPAVTQRVLLVEDDRVTATLIQHRLVREGFDVMDFLNGDDAFRWAPTGMFDLAILDRDVPGMDGFELLERLRAIPRHADVPIIVLTGMGREADVMHSLELGADDYLLKPFSPAQLLARVRRLAADAAHGGRQGERRTEAM